MEPVFSDSLVIGILSIPGLIVFLLSLVEIIDEYRFRKTAVFTEGLVVKAISSKYKSRTVEYTGGTSGTSESTGGYLLLVEYTVENGYTYTAKSKQSFSEYPSTVPVAYNPNKVTEVMIDGYYKSGNSKYYRLLMGFLLGVTPIVAYWLF